MNRLWRWIFVAVQALMFNVVVPGHARGQMTVAGWDQKSTPSCCSDETKHDAKPTDAAKLHCAVCYFAAGMALPPPVMVAPTLFGRAWPRADEVVLSFRSATLELSLGARGPPR